MSVLESQEEDTPRRVLYFTSVGTQIPFLPEMTFSVCGSRKFQIRLDWHPGDHLCTCTSHSDVKKTHDWSVDQITDLFRTTHKVKTQQVGRNRGQRDGDIELTGYLVNATGLVTLVLDLRITFWP